MILRSVLAVRKSSNLILSHVQNYPAKNFCGVILNDMIPLNISDILKLSYTKIPDIDKERVIRQISAARLISVANNFVDMQIFINTFRITPTQPIKEFPLFCCRQKFWFLMISAMGHWPG